MSGSGWGIFSPKTVKRELFGGSGKKIEAHFYLQEPMFEFVKRCSLLFFPKKPETRYGIRYELHRRTSEVYVTGPNKGDVVVSLSS